MASACNIPELKQKAQLLLGIRGRLVGTASTVLDEGLTVTQAALSMGDVLTLQAKPCSVAATHEAFSAMFRGRPAVT